MDQHVTQNPHLTPSVCCKGTMGSRSMMRAAGNISWSPVRPPAQSRVGYEVDEIIHLPPTTPRLGFSQPVPSEPHKPVTQMPLCLNEDNEPLSRAAPNLKFRIMKARNSQETLKIASNTREKTSGLAQTRIHGDRLVQSLCQLTETHKTPRDGLV